MEAECLEKNRIFFHYITEKTPYVHHEICDDSRQEKSPVLREIPDG